jgi:hypothetical protein
MTNPDQQLAGSCDFGVILGKQYRRTGVFLDDRGSIDSFP